MSADASFCHVNYAIALTDSRVKSALHKVIEKLTRSLRILPWFISHASDMFYACVLDGQTLSKQSTGAVNVLYRIDKCR